MKQILVNRFNVCPSEINYYQNRKFKYLSKTETEIKDCKCMQIEKIEINKDVGTTRPDIDADNFEEFIDTFHKEYLLNKSNDVLSEIISNPNNGHPEIYSYNGEYYLCGEGKHRIIIALLMGMLTMPVIVYKD